MTGLGVDRPHAVRELGVRGFIEESLSRNADVIHPHEQAALRTMHVLCAGCGSVGGAVVEPLARMGVRSFTLADPEAYEASNLNRQGCYVADIGRNKAEVMGERVRAINPFARVRVFPDGLSEQNMGEALDGVTVVFDGVDAEVALWEKWCLHRDAALRRIPVVSGVDLGGTPVLYVWDYRRDQRPFHGKARSEDHREGRYVESLRWLGVRSTPADWTEVMRKRALSGDPWPQVAYTVSGLGAIGSRTLLELALGRPVRHVVRVDLHQLPRSLPARVRERARFPAGMARALATLRRHPRGSARPPAPRHLPDLPAGLHAALEAARRAPSPHNTQPWRLVLEGAGGVRLDYDRDRLLAVADPQAHNLLYALGCAVEAMAAVAEVELEPAGGADPLEPSWYAGRLRVGALREDDYPEADALLAARGTNRTDYARDAVPVDALTRFERLAADHGVGVSALDARRDLRRAAELVGEAAAAQFADPSLFEELLRWSRLSAREEAASPDGFTAAGLQLEPPAALAMRLLRRPGPLTLAAAAGALREFGRATARPLEHSGAVLLLTLSDRSAHGRLEAGRALMAIWLEATRRGLSVQPLSVALSEGDAGPRTLELFGAPAGGEAMALLRLGRAPVAPPPSLRLPLERICSVDRAAWEASR